jgi:hypothetical protein
MYGGLGDITPHDKRFSCLSFFIILAGLSIVSMTINVIQTNVDRAFDQFLAAMDSEFKVNCCC